MLKKFKGFLRLGYLLYPEKKIQNCIEKIMPMDRFFILIFAFIFNSMVYSGARIIAGNWHHHILTSRLDEKIPLISESLFIYFGCYIFWAVNYIIMAKQDEEKAYQFFFADMISRIICFSIFLLQRMRQLLSQ